MSIFKKKKKKKGELKVANNTNYFDYDDLKNDADRIKNEKDQIESLRSRTFDAFEEAIHVAYNIYMDVIKEYPRVAEIYNTPTETVVLRKMSYKNDKGKIIPVPPIYYRVPPNMVMNKNGELLRIQTYKFKDGHMEQRLVLFDREYFDELLLDFRKEYWKPWNIYAPLDQIWLQYHDGSLFKGSVFICYLALKAYNYDNDDRSYKKLTERKSKEEILEGIKSDMIVRAKGKYREMI